MKEGYIKASEQHEAYCLEADSLMALDPSPESHEGIRLAFLATVIARLERAMIIFSSLSPIVKLRVPRRYPQ